MESRVERNKRYRKKKGRFYLFILIILFLFMLALYQIDQSFHERMGDPGASRLFAVKNSEDSIGVIVLGRDIAISRNGFQQSMDFLKETPKKISAEIYRILQKVSN